MNLDEVARIHDISDINRLNEVLIDAGDANIEAWKDDRNPVGHDSLDNLAEHLKEAMSLLSDPANHRALERACIEVIQIRITLTGLYKTMLNVHEPKKRGRRQKKAARALVRVLVDYWTKELGREFTQYWAGKDSAGQLIPASDGARFVFHMAQVLDLEPDEMIALPTATKEAVRTLRK